eukprot:CAMPEP_0202966542 /NCGR_PEP_ID=MMETSP1396-20130829/11006_1 /ASSEMBLY_ACC=CAM_ASM_000872 /TAXON_ID= /ORGANISM="Pseudokeronopsis sp., Strain Brazil" /LENGTH=33 /DNA_ID= /DNA_START= /DNA_END= /DNA_ORIENTATION=
MKGGKTMDDPKGLQRTIGNLIGSLDRAKKVILG